MQSHETHCSNTRSVNVIRAGKPRSTWKDDMELDIDVDMEGFQNTSSVVFSNSQSNIFPTFPNNPNSISNKLSSISLDGKRKRQDKDVDVHKSARMDTEITINAEEKKMRNSGDKFRIPVVLAWINQNRISCTRNVNSLIDTGSEITVMNACMIGERLMPWRHRDTKLRIIGANGQRLAKSGKVIVKSVDLRIRDASNGKERTFKPTYEIADLGPKEDLIIGMDWMNTVVDSIKINSYGLVFKRAIDIVNTDDEDLTELIQQAAYVGVITVPNQWSLDRKRVFSISVSADDKNTLLEAAVPAFYYKFEKVFGKEMQSALPKHGAQDCTIELLPNTEPPSGKLYPMSQDELQLLREYIEEMVATGKIRPRKGHAGSPVFFVKEKTGKMRLVVDYRGLNAITIKDKYPIPLMTTLMERVQESTWFTKLDLKNGFNLIRVKAGDEWKTAFKTRYGLYEYKVMPFGLTNAPSVFQRYVNEVLKEYIERGVVAYIDDILIYSKTEEELVVLMKKVLKKLLDNSLCINAKKCVFHACEVEFVGYTIGQNGVNMSENKVKHILEWEAPSSVHEVQQFLGFANFYRRFIRGYSLICRPLTQLTKKGQVWNWTNECQEAFNKLKVSFTEAPILTHYHPKKPLMIEIDASDLAKGAVLSQYEDSDKKWHPVASYIKKFSPAELNYDIHNKEMVVIVDCFKEW